MNVVTLPSGGRIFTGLLWLLGTWVGQADHAQFGAAADTTLIETAPNNNMGGQTFFNAGTAGTGTKNRGVFQFDVSSIPPQSIILEVNVTLQVVGEPIPGNGRSSTFLLHRLLRPWGEGDKLATVLSPGLGLPATQDEATWNHRFAQTTEQWAVSGGAAGVDYVSTSSVSQFIEEARSYVFEDTERLVADVQAWVNHAGTNFGWLLRTSSESVHFTARRFGSKETQGSGPLLDVEFIPPPVLMTPRIESGDFKFSFVATANQGYAVEYTTNLIAGAWSTLLTVPASPVATNVLVTDPLSAQRRFYRVTF